MRPRWLRRVEFDDLLRPPLANEAEWVGARARDLTDLTAEGAFTESFASSLVVGFAQADWPSEGQRPDTFMSIVLSFVLS